MLKRNYIYKYIFYDRRRRKRIEEDIFEGKKCFRNNYTP